MEHRTVLVKKLKIGSLFDMYTPTVQDEPLTLNEEDALNNLRREFSSITSTALLNQLEKDCSLDTLSFSDEHNTLEEVIQIVPDRSPELMPLNTFTHLPQNDMKSMSRTSLLGLLDRVPSPSVDLSYNIHPGDSNETLTKPIDLLVTIGVYKPVPVSQMDLCTQAHYMTMAQRLVLLASQSLAVLKDAIRCPQDKVWLGDCSNALDDSTLHVAAEKLYTSSYFFIEGTFYDDLRNLQNKTLSSSLIGWAKTKQELDSLGPFTQTTMETTMLRDLSVYIGKPYFYVHQGNCEHAIVFLDVHVKSENST
ncbi:snRNA-activating protein complex subunit 3 [Fasciola hepatica]|uniref:snRNA-activating protein complex subunit 3 n=1 Tax=Fasciola hepatica TaxID=6192 RepID=A0A4E0QTY6_FASHE|nr:snRNA-activating protein complex subunit 3 [Fasciola hepatica]